MTDRRNALAIIAHPEETAFGRAILNEALRGLRDAGNAVEVADLTAEGFDPRMTAADLAFYRGQGDMPEDVRREQARVDRADGLVIAFPLYWWSLPGLLKGWVDRVLTGGWAYRYTPDGKAAGLLADRPVRLLVTAATDETGYRKHGYHEAVTAQIQDGIFRFCGLRQVETHVLFEVESADPAVRTEHLRTAYRVGKGLFAGARHPEGSAP